jgi:hypothetical protein
MTIEIRQLIIRASVTERSEPAASPPASSIPVSVTSDHNSIESNSAALAAQRDALVATCVREVLRELKKKARER